MNRTPSAGNKVQNGPQADQRAADVNRSLHHVSPDHGRQPAFKCIDERQYSNNGDRGYFARSQSDRHHNRHGIDAHSLGRRPRQQKQTGGQRAQAAPKAPFNQFIGSVKIAAKVMRKQNKADYDAPHHVSHYYLQEGKVGVVGKARNADDGKCAGLGGNDGERNGPPGNITSSQKIIAQRALPLAEAQSEQSDSHQVKRDDREIKPVKSHNSNVETVLDYGVNRTPTGVRLYAH